MKKLHVVLTLLLSLGVLASCNGGESVTSEVTAATYKILAPADNTDYTITGLPTEAKAGDKIRFTIKTNGDKVVTEVKANDDVLTSSGSTNVYRFTMPEKDVTITVKLGAVTSISLDTSAVTTSFFVGGTFTYEGLKVKATMEDNSTVELSSGYQVSTPDLSTSGAKEITVTYGGKTATYTITVGNFTPTTAAISASEDGTKALFNVSGTYEGFASTAALTSAAKGVAGINLQNHSGYGISDWQNAYGTEDITFSDGSDALSWNYTLDLSEFAGAGGTGRYYIVHFGVIGTNSNGETTPANLNIPIVSEEALTIGSKSYSLWFNSSWNVVEIVIKDSQASYITPDSYTLSYDETADVVYMNISGKYGYLTEAQLASDALTSTFYLDMLQFTSWTMINATTDALNAPDAVKITPDAEDASLGQFAIKLPIARFSKMTAGANEGDPAVAGEKVALDTTEDYFFHFANASSNLKADITTGQTGSTVTDKDGGIYTLYTIATTDWKTGLLGLKYLGGDYVTSPSSVTLANKDSKVTFTMMGKYANITDTTDAKYYADIMSFEDTTALNDATTTVTLTPETSEATRGTYTIDIDLTGHLEANKTYFFHYGEENTSGGRTNLAVSVTETTVKGSDGTYILKNASGYTENNETWRNGLAIVTFTPKAA